MKKPTFLNNWIVVLVLLLGFQSFAQDFVPFSSTTAPVKGPRFDADLRGDMVLIGNNILGPNRTTAFNDDSAYNDEENMRYIDIDGDGTTFSSSSSDLVIPNPECYRIVHAGLYWGAVTPGSQPISNIKFRGPTGGYNDIVGEVIYNDPSSSADGGDSFPYACFADVTGIVNGLANNRGTYTVANVSSREGRSGDISNFTGWSAGWSLFVVYEDPRLPGKSITSFDGFSAISRTANPALDINISGFRTIPTGPVRANFAFAALEGDKPITGDRLRINGRRLSALDRNRDNFFSSTISQLSGLPVNNRNPNSTNTLGFDTGIITVPNPSNGVIDNGDTSATVRLETSGDTYFPYFFAFGVDIIEPKIVLTKIVEDDTGANIGGMVVDLGDDLNYVIGVQNIGNDHASNLTITDVLPINVDFDFPADLGVLPAGVTVQSYDPGTRTIIFDIEDFAVAINAPAFEIRFGVQVVASCSLLDDACSNMIDNQAFAEYSGTINPDFDSPREGSFDTNTGCLLVPKATNFLADLDDCIFEEEVILCGDEVILTAANGYTSYSWSRNPSGTPVIGTTQSITVTETGTYYSRNNAAAPCQSIDQIFNVITFGANVTNPVIPFANQVVICPNDGEQLPNIFLCGASDFTSIITGITDASSIIWERFDEGSCDVRGDGLPVNCPINLDRDAASNLCTWSQVATGPDYIADTAGEYRLTLNYTGGCFNQFFFNVFENIFEPTFTSRDIFCSTPGEIVVGSVPSGYEFSLDGITYQPSNVFSINTPDNYTVYIRQVGITTNPCIFTIPNIQIRERDFTISTTVTQPLCNDGMGSVIVAANDVRPQYFFSIRRNGVTLVNSVGPIAENSYTFPNLNPGMYQVRVETADGCLLNEDIEIINPPLLTATVALTTPLTSCTDGEITVFPVGGTPTAGGTYFYFVNGDSTFQTTPEIAVTTPGTYNIRVVDFNNCETNTSITVNTTLPPDFNVTKTDLLCSGSGNTGAININVTNANGNTLQYSIDDGVTFVSSPVFNGLAVGNYEVVVQYTIGTSVCTTPPETVNIIELSALTGTATLTTPYTCTTNGVITVSGVSGGTAPYEYSIDGVDFQNGLTFTGLTDGTYTVTIRDDNDCTFTAPAIVIVPLDPPTDLDFSNSALSCPLNTSTVTITATGGFGALEYQITAPAASATAYQSSNEFLNLAPDTYTFQIRDANNCTYSESYTITPLPALTVVGQLISDISCLGASDGAVRFTVSGSTNFTYTINGGSSTAGTSPIDLTGLASGNYNVVITDTTTTCTATASVTVNAPPVALSITTTVTPLTCIADGNVVINAVGGWGGNMYTLTQPDTTVLPAQTSNIFPNLTQTGTYTATVTDANGCVATDTFDLITPSAPTGSLNASSDLCYDVTDAATLVVDASGGQIPYEYNINGGPFGSSNTFPNLTPGDYIIIIRDAFGCEFPLPTQTIAPQLELSAALDKELDCTVSPDASIIGTITGGASPYTIEVSINGGGFIPVGGFPFGTPNDGTYQFRVTDANMCEALSSVITVNPIENPTATVAPVNPNCEGGADGSVQITPADGVGPYTFSFNGSAFTTVSLYENLSAGISYPYEVRDSKNCNFTSTVTLTEPSTLAATAAVIPFSCDVNNAIQSGTVTVTETLGTGTGPYQYSFNGSGFSAINVFTVNDNGTDQTVNYQVRDAQGCIAIGSRVLIALNSPTDLDFVPSPVTCLATTSTVALTATDGVGTLTYEIREPAASVTSNTTGNFVGLSPDTYVFRVTDANGCFYEESYIVEPVTNIAVTGTLVSDVNCNGGTDGAVTYTVSDFTGNYSYTFNGGTAVTGQTATAIPFTGLSAGNQTINITDEATGCTTTATVNISEPTNALTFTATATNVFCTDDESQITVTATDGTPNYTYAAVVAGDPAPTVTAYISNNVVTVDTNSGADLTWDVYVRDSNGCVTTNPITIISDTLPTVTTPAISSNQCTVASGFTFTATGTGVAPLSYSINGGGSYQTSPTFTVNTPGTYTVTIRDGNGCTATSTISTEVFAQLTVSANLTKELDCTVSPDAIISGTITGGDTPYVLEVSINGGGFNAVGAPFPYTTLSNGTYQFRVTDANMCEALSNVITVNPIENPTATVTPINPNCTGAADGSVQIVPSDGVGPYTFSFNGSAFTTVSLYENLSAGIAYPYEVRDSKNCSFTSTVTLTEPTTLVATAAVIPFSCDVNNAIQSGTVTVTETLGTGTGPYQYSFNGSGFSAINVFTVNDNGTDQTVNYQVRDAQGCIAIGSRVLIALNSPTDLDFVPSPVTCLATTSTVALTATDGVGTLTYEIREPAASVTSNTTGNFVGLSPDTYVFRVTDANGCFYEESYIVEPVTNIAVTGTLVSDVSCNGGTDGAVTYTVSDFTGNYSYTFNGGTAVTGQTATAIPFTGLSAGNQIINITDDVTGCTTTATVNVSEPINALTFTAIATNVFCTDDESQITITAADGTPNYSYAAVVAGDPAPAVYASNNVVTVDTNSGADLIWDVYVRDSNGCVTTNPITIISDTLPTVTTPAIPSNQCTVASGFTFIATGSGVAPLSYSINGGTSYQTSPTFTVNTPGTYTVTIRDGNGCTATSTTSIVVSPGLTASATLTKDLTCSAPADATIDIIGSGGTGTYITFEVSTDGGSTYNPIAGSPYSTGTAGTYQFRVTDSNNCTAETNAIIVNPVVLPVITSLTPEPVRCHGDSNGAIAIIFDNTLGEPPFEINVNNDTSSTDFGTQTTGLPAGDYTITLTDGKGCTDVETTTIATPDALDFQLFKVDITCDGATGSSLGSITVSGADAIPTVPPIVPIPTPIIGGTGSLTYYISNNFGDVIPGSPYVAISNEPHTFNIINFGIYTIEVVDSNGCSLSREVTIASPPSDLAIDVTTVSSTCAAGGTAEVRAVSVVGSGNYEFGILEFNTAPYTLTYFTPDTPSGDTRTFTNLTPGVLYTFVVHDLTTNCYFIKSAPTPIPPASTLTSTVVPNNVTCIGNDDGSATFTIDNFDSTTTSVDYEIFTAFSNVSVGPVINLPVTFGTPETVTAPSPGTLSPGQYYIVFTENGSGAFNGCRSASDIFEIRESAIDLSVTTSIIKNENCNELGTISAIARDGTAPYQYQITTSATAPLATDPSWASASVFDVSANTYFVHVLDAFGCIRTSVAQVVVRDTEPTINPVALQCYTGTPLSITLLGTVSVGTPSYSIGGAFQSSPNFTINTPGTYTLSIRDSNGCITTTSYIVSPQLLLDADLAQDLTCTVDGTIDLTASGGTGTYATYEVSFNGSPYAVIAGSPYTATTDGTYQFRVTDSQPCQAESAIITVTPTTTPTLTHIQTNVSCNGGADGSIVVTAANGIAPYQYSIDGSPFQASNVFDGLAATGAGVPYQIVVRDSKNCDSAATPVTIIEPTAVGATLVVTQGLTCGIGNTTQSAILTATGNNGTPPYTYSFDGGLNYTTTNTFRTNVTGLVSVLVRDANGCISPAETETVPGLNPPTDLDFVSTPVTCLALTSTVTLTATGGDAPLAYRIVSPASATSNTTGASSGIFTGLGPDTYLFEVSDGNSCTYQESHIVAPLTNIAVSGLLVSNVTCNGLTDGAVTFTVSGFGTSYSYTINGGTAIPAQTATTIVLTGLPAVDQIIEVTDEVTNCTDTFTVPVAEPSLVTLVPTVNLAANCNFGAQVTVEATGGTPGYTYAFVEDGITPVASDYTNSPSRVLDPAINTAWDAYVLDAQGCPQMTDITISTDPLPIIDPVAQQCYTGTPFNITLTGTAVGTPLYSIGSGFQASPTFAISTPGTYNLTIRDGNGCEAMTTYIVAPQLLLDADLVQDLTCTVDATINLTALGGTGIYTYEVSFNGAPYSVIAGTPHVVIADGTYQFRVTDSQLCQAESSILTVTPRTIPTLIPMQTNVSCNGGSDGSIVVTAADGIAPYQYSIDNGVTFQASNVFNGLSPTGLGIPYQVLVRDSKNCDSAVTPVIITEPTVVGVTLVLTQGLTCGAGNTTQSAILTATGNNGTPPYTYSFDGGLNYTTDNIFRTNISGLVSVLVRDANGCISLADTETVPVLNPPTDLDFVSTPVTCLSLTSTVTITTPIGGDAPLTYRIVSPASATSNTTGATNGIFTGLGPDTYLFEVSDANSCTYQESYIVAPVTNIAVSGLLVSNVSCNGLTDGEVTFTVSGFGTSYSYTINGSAPIPGQTATTIPLTGLSAINQVIEVTDEVTNCTATFTVPVAEPSLLTLTPTVNLAANCNFGAQVTVEATGGTPGYTYAFVEDGIAPVASDYINSPSRVLDPATNTAWDAYVLDAQGCIEMVDITISTDPLPMVTVPAIASNQCNLNGDPYTFTVIGTGVAPLTYSIGSGFQSNDTFTVTTPGTYTVTVRDGNGCEAVGTPIIIYPPIDLSTAEILPICTNNDGQITVTGTGGSGTYTYAISPLAGTQSGNVFSGLSVGTYTVTITDGVTNCSNDVDVILSTPTLVTFTTSVENVTCNGGNDGIITVNLPASNDNPIYTYEIIAPIIRPAQNTNIFTGLPQGTYTVRVNSGRGCFLDADVPVTEPVLLTVTGNTTDFGCAADNSVNPSTLTITEVGGTAPYTYSIDGVNYFTTNTFDIIDTGVAQTINISVIDANGCPAMNTVNIAPLPALVNATAVIATPIDCNNTGSVTINVNGGSGNFEYLMLPGGTPQASNTFSIPGSGTYFFQVNDLDTGCSIITEPFTVVPFDTIDVAATATTPVTCFGDTNGTLEINVTDYTGAYNYDILDSSGTSVRGLATANTSTNPLPITGLSGGNYTVVVTETDSPFCSTTSNVVTIESPAFPLMLTADETSNVTCDNDKGTISATAIGGLGTYEYELTGAATVAYSPNGTFTNLAAGSYTVNVIDAGGCIVSDSVILTEPTPINATVTPSTALLTCFGDTNASITVSNVTGGEIPPNYSYTLNTLLPTVNSSGPQASPVFDGLGAGTYTVTITDGFNCEFTSANIVITAPTQVQADLVQATSQTCTTDASLTLSATGGTGSYEYSDTMAFTTVLGSFTTSTTFSVPRPAGTADSYAYYVRDANGCIANVSNTITVEPFIDLTVTLDADASNTRINCEGDNNGVIVANAQGGIGNYTYTLLDGAGAPVSPVTQDSPGVFTGLIAGDYQVSVIDGDCSDTLTSISITNASDRLEVDFDSNNITCFGDNTGTFSITAIRGGFGTIKYAISPQLNQFLDIDTAFDDLGAGVYQVIVQDELGCFELIDFTITESTPIITTLVAGSLMQEACFDDDNGEFSVQISGGQAPYTVTIDDGNGISRTGIAVGEEVTFSGLDGGREYFVDIIDSSDAVGCPGSFSIILDAPVDLRATVDVDYGCTGNTATNTVTVILDDPSLLDPLDLDYSIDGGATYQSSNIFTNVAPGLGQVITVRHSNTCDRDTPTFDILAFDPLTVTLAETNQLNLIEATADGGDGNYAYEFMLDGEILGTESSLIIYESGNYTVTVTDGNTCVATATMFFEFVDVCVPNYFTPNGDGREDGWAPGCTINYKDLTFDVFDRYGRKVGSYRLGQQWDGRYEGKELPTGDYWYVLKLNDAKDDREFVGHFTLYR